MSFAEAVGASGQQPVAHDVTMPNFNRKTNPTKLFCNLHDRAKAPKKNLVVAISNLALEAGLKENDFTIFGDALDNRFEFQFSGDARVASLRTLQFYESLLLGRWQGRTKLWLVIKKRRC